MTRVRRGIAALTASGLRGPRFELGKKKEFKLLPGFQDYTRKLKTAPYEGDFLELRRCLVGGRLVPERLYRAGIDNSEDELLEVLGVKHIHLGGQNSNVLAYVFETVRSAIVLQVNDHQNLETEPVGLVLESVIRGELQGVLATERAEAELESAAAEAEATTLSQRIRDGIFGLKK